MIAPTGQPPSDDDLPQGERQFDLQLDAGLILNEMQRRLTRPLNEPDALAIATAVDKAIVAGFEAGAARVAFEVVDRGYTITLNTNPLEVRDRWADRYEPQADEDGG